MTKRGKEILRVSIGAALFVAAVIIVALATPALDSLQATLPYPLLSLVIFLVPYLVLGWPVLKKAARNIAAATSSTRTSSCASLPLAHSAWRNSPKR